VYTERSSGGRQQQTVPTVSTAALTAK
jgi:hypothetical protein